MSRHAPDCFPVWMTTNLIIMVPLTWIEHVASPLPRECSTTELQGHRCPYLVRSTKTGAGEGNRTLVVSLEGFSSTIELHPQGPSTSAAHCFPRVTAGGGGWIRTSVLVRGQIYSLLPLTTRPPLRREPQTIVEGRLPVNEKCCLARIFCEPGGAACPRLGAPRGSESGFPGRLQEIVEDGRAV